MGNPAEVMWDKLMSKYGGRVVGYREQDVLLEDGKLYDVKEYELMAKNYYTEKGDRLGCCLV
jgi:hypothetical protein